MNVIIWEGIYHSKHSIQDRAGNHWHESAVMAVTLFTLQGQGLLETGSHSRSG